MKARDELGGMTMEAIFERAGGLSLGRDGKPRMAISEGHATGLLAAGMSAEDVAFIAGGAGHGLPALEWDDCPPRGTPDYPEEMYVDDAAMQRLLLAHGKKVTAATLRTHAGSRWDGGPGQNKWYECLDAFGVEYPDAAL